MSVRGIDENNDWNFGRGRSDYRRDLPALIQDLRTRLQSFLGDCFFALGEGIDWFNLLGSKDSAELSLAIAAVILNTDGVVQIVDFQLLINENNRAVTFEGSIDSVFGEVNLDFPLDLEVLDA